MSPPLSRSPCTPPSLNFLLLLPPSLFSPQPPFTRSRSRARSREREYVCCLLFQFELNFSGGMVTSRVFGVNLKQKTCLVIVLVLVYTRIEQNRMKKVFVNREINYSYIYIAIKLLVVLLDQSGSRLGFMLDLESEP